MKKLLALLLSLLLLTPALAEAPETVDAYVSITDATGALVLACEPVQVADLDGDGALTIADALQAAHDLRCPGGFALAQTGFGLSMTKLWGTEGGSSFGYCLNDASAWSLADPIANGDHIKAYAYTDLIAWSDAYCYFDVPMLTVSSGEEVSLHLRANGFDEMWNPVVMPVAGAAITVDGAETGLVTDSEGAALLPGFEPGVYVVSAFSAQQILVAPVCVITVTAR